MPSEGGAAEVIALSRAAAIAYDELVAPAHQSGLRDQMIDLLALGISQDTPIYAVRPDGALAPIDAVELRDGRFSAGASRFEFHDGRAPLEDLRVRISELPAAVRRVVARASGHPAQP